MDPIEIPKWSSAYKLSVVEKLIEGQILLVHLDDLIKLFSSRFHHHKSPLQMLNNGIMRDKLENRMNSLFFLRAYNGY